MTMVCIGLGSNIEPEKNISRALSVLKSHFKVLRQSSFVQTEAVGHPSQTDFLNGAILLKTDLSLEELKKRLKNLEIQLGRNPLNHRGPRTIDLDVLVWDNQIIDPDIGQREFLKTSILEVIPDLEIR